MRPLLLVVALASCGTSGPASAPGGPVERAPASVGPASSAPVTTRATLAVGNQEACAIAVSGKVACWGIGGAGRFGTPDDADQPTPVELPGIADAAGVVLSAQAGCAWTTRGEVLCWNDDRDDNYALDRRPFAIAGLTDIVQVTTAGLGACGLHATGQVSCWEIDRNPLMPHVHAVAGLADAVEIAGFDGGMYSQLCARQQSGAVVCTSDHGLVDRPALAGATSLAATFGRAAALLPGHRLVTWGLLISEEPVEVGGVDGERVVVGPAPGDALFEHRVCVLGAATRCWLVRAHAAPVEERALPAVRDLAFDNDLLCTRTGDAARCAGRTGRLGDGVPEHEPGFVPVHGLADARQLEASGRTTCALRATGTVACWGQALAPRGWREIGDDGRGSSAAGRAAGGQRGSIDWEPVTLPGVTDASELAMAGGIGNLGDQDDWAIACARNGSGATCWSTTHGALEAHAAPELAGAVRLFSGTEVCGVSKSGAVRCTHFATDQLCTRSEAPQTECHASGDASEQHELEHQLQRALAHGAPLPSGMRAAAAIAMPSPLGDVDFTVAPDGRVARHHRAPAPLLDEQGGPRAMAYSDTTHDGPPDFAPPLDALAHVVQLRVAMWVGRDGSPGVLCVRRTDGGVACWGERDELGAGEHSTRRDPVAVTGLVLGTPGRVTPAPAVTSPAPPVAPSSPPALLAPHPMQGPYRDVRAACLASPCPGRETARHCDELADPAAASPGDAMPQPPAPFTAVQLVSFDCRAPNDQYRDDLHRLRLAVTRADGVWLSAALTVIGKAAQPCFAYWHADWQTDAARIVLSLVAGKRCSDATGGEDDAVVLTVVAADGKPPVTSVVTTATSHARGCLPGTSCQPSVQVTPAGSAAP